MELLRITFPVSGSEIPLDHGYAVFSAISGLVPEIHANRRVAIAPIRGVFKAPTTLTLAPFSRLTVITPLTLVPDLFVLSGKLLAIGGSPVLLGRMVLTPIAPCESVGSRLVVFSFPEGLEINEENFGTEVRRQLGLLDLQVKPRWQAKSLPGQERKASRLWPAIRRPSAGGLAEAPDRGSGGASQVRVWGLFAYQESDHSVIRAKSSGLSLEDHTSHVIAATSTLVERCGMSALSAFGLPVSMLPRLRESTLRAARVHDWGKATSSYQGFLEDGSEQMLRHEILSGILAREAGESPEVLAVAVGHHRKFNRDFWSPKGIDCRIFSSAIGQGEDSSSISGSYGASSTNCSTPWSSGPKT